MTDAARMDPWTVVEAGTDLRRLFGYLERHPTLGGKSWAFSSPIVALTEAHAVTASGRHYALGQRILLSQLPDEAHVALRCLNNIENGVESDAESLHWLYACKAARWLDLPIPDRHDPETVAQFLRDHSARYVAMRDDRARRITEARIERMTP